MNRKTTYELTITEKLQHLPLPNLEDAIWARVKAQLDLDLPTDDNDGGEGPDTPSTGGWVWGGGLFLFVAAFVAVFFLRKTDVQPSVSPSIPTQNAAPVASPVPQPSTVPAPVTNGREPTPLPLTPSGISPGSFASPGSDSLAVAPPLTTLPAADSLQRTTLVVPPPVVVDTTRPGPKTKGVRGLTDADYRIVPARRDSS